MYTYKVSDRFRRINDEGHQVVYANVSAPGEMNNERSLQEMLSRSKSGIVSVDII